MKSKKCQIDLFGEEGSLGAVVPVAHPSYVPGQYGMK